MNNVLSQIMHMNVPEEEYLFKSYFIAAINNIFTLIILNIHSVAINLQYSILMIQFYQYLYKI